MSSCFCPCLFLYFISLASAITGLSFDGSKYSFAEFKPWDISSNGVMEIYFKTAKKDSSLVLYQDDGLGQDWIDVFLIKGSARLRVRMGECHFVQGTTVKGNFTDSKWHQLTIRRNFSLTSIAVDKHRPQSINCEETFESPAKPRPSKSSLYLGGIPLFSRQRGHWSNPNIFYEALEHTYTGCITRVRYGDNEKELRKARYRNSSGTTNTCHGPCALQRLCKNGGKCIEMVVSMHCDCHGTGFTGKYCEQKAAVDTTNVTSNSTMNFEHVREESAGLEPLYLIVVMVICSMIVLVAMVIFVVLMIRMRRHRFHQVRLKNHQAKSHEQIKEHSTEYSNI